MDFYGFYTGTEFEAYSFLGAHPQGNGIVFRTFAPGARRIEVIGEFNSWQGQDMGKIHDGNFWECTAADARPENSRTGADVQIPDYRGGRQRAGPCGPLRICYGAAASHGVFCVRGGGIRFRGRGLDEKAERGNGQAPEYL